MQIRKVALACIELGDDAEAFPDDSRQVVDAEIKSLRDAGVGPKRAAALLARLRAGGLYAIDGGGAAPRKDGPRPLLALVRPL